MSGTSPSTRKEQMVSRFALATSLICVLVVASTIGVLATPSLRIRFNPPPKPAYAAGERIDIPAPLFDAAPRTVVIFARSTCAGCQHAEPALAALVRSIRRQPDTRVVLASVTGGGPAEVKFAHDMGLEPDQVVAIRPKGLRLRIVPTVVLVDQTGTIRYAWEPTKPLADVLTLGGLFGPN